MLNVPGKSWTKLTNWYDIIAQACECVQYLPEHSVCGFHTKPELGHSEKNREDEEGLEQTQTEKNKS